MTMLRYSASALAAASIASAAAPSLTMYFDQYHPCDLPDKEVTKGITNVITAFAPSDIFNSNSSYEPFMELDKIRGMFDDGVKVSMAIGGWADTAGFGAAAATDESRKNFAKNVADAVNRLGYDGVDVDWEYPGGNGDDYKVVTNDKKTSEIEAYPELMCAIKEAIGPDKELSTAIPGREVDMIAFTPENMEKLNNCTDTFNVMTYDLMNRRDTETNHHSSVKGSAQTIDTYKQRGMDPAKMSLGFPFYAKFFETEGECDQPLGCKTVLLENENGTDTGKSGAVTFEPANSNNTEFMEAIANGKSDDDQGGQWYWNSTSKNFWTWDGPDHIKRKMKEIVGPKNLKGVFAWSLCEDSQDWKLLNAMKDGVKELSGEGGEGS